MSKEKELEDILESLKEHKQQLDKDIEPVLPPKEYGKDDELLWIDNEDIKNKINSADAPLEPPKIYRNGQEKVLENLDNDSSKKQKVNKKEKQNNSKKAKKDKKNKKSKDVQHNNEIEITFPKIMAVIVSIIVVVALIIGVVFYVNRDNQKNPQTLNNGFSYEKDIMSEYKNKYINDNRYCGELVIDDLSNSDLYNFKNDNSSYFYNGSDIANLQHINSIDVSNYGDGLENLYSTISGYQSASQKVIVNTLFEKKAYKVIGAYYTNKDAKDNCGYVFPYTINGTLTKQNFGEYRDGVKARMLYNTGYDIMYDDEILNLCSDSNSIMPNYKFVVVCVRMDKIKHTDIVADSQSAVYYPQSYYDVNKLVNPYQNAKGLNWFPKLIIDGDEEKTLTLKQQDYIEK